MIFVSYCLIGVFVLSHKRKIVDFSLFPKDTRIIAERIEELKDGKVVKELEEVLKRTKDKNVVTDINFKHKGFNIEFKKNLLAARHLREDIKELMVETGFANDVKEANRIISEVQVIRTKRKLKSGGSKDKVAMQAVSCIEDLTDISNRLSERLHEWYGLYYPELETKVKDNKKFAETIASEPKRENMKGFEGTIGLDLDERDLEILKIFSDRTKEIFELKDLTEIYLEKIMKEIAPNVTAIAGATLAARLLVLAGGLENLAKLPSSTIQLLGAEKALFRFMKSKKKTEPPKYGILFLHPKVINAPNNLRGKVARAVASEISMAAKTDFYSRTDKTEFYRKRLEKRLNEILRK